MNFTPLFRWAALCGLLALSPVVSAQTRGGAAPVPAEVQEVKFAESALNGAVKMPMGRMEVRIRAIDNAKLLADPAAIVPNKAWVDKIKVTVTVAYETSSGSAKKAGQAGPVLAFYRSAATIMTMERGTNGSIYFYLPGEIIKRDNLKREPYAYLVELDVDGTAVPLDPKMFSKNLKTPQDVAGFKEMADRGALDTAGVLRPQYQVRHEAAQALSPTLVREDTTHI